MRVVLLVTWLSACSSPAQDSPPDLAANDLASADLTPIASPMPDLMPFADLAGPVPDLAGADFSGADLRPAPLPDLSTLPDLLTAQPDLLMCVAIGQACTTGSTCCPDPIPGAFDNYSSCDSLICCAHTQIY